MQEAEATNGADRRVCILVIQADGGGVLLGRDAQKAWSLPCTQIGGDEGGPEAAGRRLAQELGLPSSAKELQCQVMPTAVSQPRTDHDQTIDEQTGMVFSTRTDRDLPELVVFSLQAPGLSALRSGTCGFEAVAFHRRDELPASLALASRKLVLEWCTTPLHEQGSAAGGAANGQVLRGVTVGGGGACSGRDARPARGPALPHPITPTPPGLPGCLYNSIGDLRPSKSRDLRRKSPPETEKSVG